MHLIELTVKMIHAGQGSQTVSGLSPTQMEPEFRPRIPKHREFLVSHRVQTDVIFSRGSRRRFHSSTTLRKLTRGYIACAILCQASREVARLNVLRGFTRTMQAIGAGKAIFT
jgi:hypothetical protein